MPPGDEKLLHPDREQGPVWGVVVATAADRVREVDPAHDVLLGDDVLPLEESRLPHPGLGREVDEVRALEPGHVRAGVVEELAHPAPTLELGRGEVGDLHAVETGHVRAVAPDDAGERGLQPPVLPAPADEALGLPVDLREALRLPELEPLGGVRVDPADPRYGGDDVGPLLERRPRARGDVEVARRVDHHVAPDGLRPLLGLDDRPRRPPVLVDDRRLEPAVQAKLDPCLGNHLEGGVLEAVRVECGREDDGVGLGVGVEVEHPPPRPLAPHRLGGPNPGVAVGVRRVHAEPPAVHALDHLHREAANGDLGVVVHVVEHEDHAARGESPEVGIALDEGHARPVPGGGDGGRDAGRAPADHQDVRRGDHGDPGLRPDQ